MSILHVAMCVPCGEFVVPEMAVSMANTAMFMCSQPVPGFEGQKISIYTQKSSLISSNRETLVTKALKDPTVTHVFFVDGDQEFPPYSVHQLVQHGKKVIAANVPTRGIPAGVNTRQSLVPEDAVTSLGKRGIEKVAFTGTGVMLIEREVFETVKQPWFMLGWIKKTKQYVGEDIMFCRKLQDAGIDIYVDHDYSHQVGHWGSYRYTHWDVDVKGWAHKTYLEELKSAKRNEGGKDVRCDGGERESGEDSTVENWTCIEDWKEAQEGERV